MAPVILTIWRISKLKTAVSHGLAPRPLLLWALATLLPLAVVAQEAPLAHQAEQSRAAGWGVETRYFAPAVDPGDDFYAYVNAGWLQQASLPQGMPRIDAFVEVYLRTEKQIQALIDDLLAGKHQQQVGAGQIRRLYESYMNEARLNELGLAPLQAGIDAIMQTSSRSGVARAMAQPLQMSVIGVGIDLDEKNPQHYTLIVSQSGLGLPGRAYYIKDDAPFPAIRAAYADYIEGVFTRAAIDQPRERAEAVLDFESQLAQLHWTPEQVRDRITNYQPMRKQALLDYAPGFDWLAFLDALNVGDQQRLIVNTNTAVRDTAALIAQTPLSTLRSYLAFHFINNQAMLLNDAFAQAHFDFFSRRLEGIAEQRPRAKVAQEYVSDTLGEVLGRLYVERHFPASQKAVIDDYLTYIRQAFRQRIAASAWMDKATKAEAFAKLDAFTAKIGYPDQWRDFSAIEIRADDLIGNNRRIAQWYYRDAIARLNEEQREWEWGMSPQEVNAYYEASRNEIVFPAAILQPPFFDPEADPAVNFAAIGAIIGHEIGHGFDDQGSLSDGEGVLRDWWTPASREAYAQRTAVLVDQYSEYQPITGIPISGELTLGENIGDLGGLTVAYTAYRNFLQDTADGQAPVIDGLTGDQRFFLAWAQLWRSLVTDDYMRQSLVSDPHSPGKYRANGVLRNMDAWYEAFDVTEHDAMYLPPARRAQIW